MLKGSSLLLMIAIVVVAALALAIHFYGPHLGRMLHGG
jgi:hypothetical protein